MSCFGCLCKFCVYNVDILPRYFTPGEADGFCYNCDECGAGHKMQGHCMTVCQHFKQAEKKIDKEAQLARSKIQLINGGKE